MARRGAVGMRSEHNFLCLVFYRLPLEYLYTFEHVDLFRCELGQSRPLEALSGAGARHHILHDGGVVTVRAEDGVGEPAQLQTADSA